MARRKADKALQSLDPKDKPLSDIEERFVAAYFENNMNATEAALAVYDTENRVSAASMGSDCLSRPNVRARVDATLAQYHLSASEVLARMAFIARGSLDEFIDESGAVDVQKAKEAHSMGLLRKYKSRHVIVTGKDDYESEATEAEVEAHDALQALTLLMKYHGLLTERSLNVNIDLSQLSDDELELVRTGKALPPRVIVRGEK